MRPDPAKALSGYGEAPNRGHLTAALCRRFGFEHIELIEDVLQEAFLKALEQWAYHDIPADPEGWLLRVAGNCMIDRLRRQKRWSEIAQGTRCPEERHQVLPMTPGILAGIQDDQLAMAYASCHPRLSGTTQAAICAKTVFGLSTKEIADLFLASPPTVGQRISRAKQQLSDVKDEIEDPHIVEYGLRTPTVLETLYLVFTSGYFNTRSGSLLRRELCDNAIHVTRSLCDHSSFSSPAALALLALMLLHGSRLRTRFESDGLLLVLSSQDRSKWDESMISEGLAALRQSASGNELSRYHLEAEIAAMHATARTPESVNWEHILKCYDQLIALTGSPVACLNRLVAVWRVNGPGAALRQLNEIDGLEALESYIPYHMLLAELHAALGDMDAAMKSFARAESLSDSPQLVSHIQKRKRQLSSGSGEVVG